MANGYTRQESGNIVTGATIEASHFNNEFNAIETAMGSSAGHTHDGTAGGGAPIPPAGLAGLSSSGIVVRASSTGFVARSITVASAGLAVASADGISGNPLISLANDLAAVEGISSVGVAVRTATDTWAVRTLTVGTGLAIASADGSAGNPLFSLANDLAAVEAVSNVGVVVRTAAETWSTRSLAVGSGLAIASADGSAGNPTITLSADLSAIAALGSSGIAVRTGSGTWAVRTLTGTASEITVTSGSGVSGNMVVSLPTALNFTGKTITSGTYASAILTGTTTASSIGTGILSITGQTTISNAGTVSAPSIAFIGDTNTGIYTSAADSMALVAGGTSIFRVNTSGVAVTGTISATGALSAVGGIITGAGNTFLHIVDSSATGAAVVTYGQGGVAGVWQAGLGAGNGSANWNIYHSATAAIRFALSSDGTTVINGTTVMNSAGKIPAASLGWSSTTKFISSADHVVSAGSAGNISVAHGLAGVPDLVNLYLVPFGTPETGFASTDLVPVNYTTLGSENSSANWMVIVDSTTIEVYPGSNLQIVLINPTTNSAYEIDKTKWKLRIKAVYFAT